MYHQVTIAELREGYYWMRKRIDCWTIVFALPLLNKYMQLYSIGTFSLVDAVQDGYKFFGPITHPGEVSE